jgi:hypothetical protein
MKIQILGRAKANKWRLKSRYAISLQCLARNDKTVARRAANQTDDLSA